MRALSTLIFPVIQGLSFYASVATFGSKPTLSLVLFLISCLALNFTVHVSLHEFVHHYQPKSNRDLGSLFFSLFAGLPFDGYRLHHYNHHQYNNQIKDYSSTWQMTAHGFKPYNLAFYAFAWLAFLEKARQNIQKDIVAGVLPKFYSERLKFQKIGLFLFYALLAAISKVAFLLYFLHVYLGWVLISLHNYGQHPPVTGVNEPTTFANSIFNAFFFKNGLHWEHHHNPSVHWSDLELSPNSKRIQVPHLLEPFTHEVQT